MFKKFFLLIYLLILYPSAFGKIYRNELNSCKPTRSYMNDYEPEKFPSGNNLLKKTGEYPLYCGHKIIVKGRALDKNCVPVPDAKVYLWQVGCDGKYPYKPLRTRIDSKLVGGSVETTFTGSGTATTDNNGEFNFITIYPAPLGREGSYVNIRVEHRSLGSLQTKLFLKPANMVISDPLLEKNSKKEEDSETVIYGIEVVLPKEGVKRY